MANFSDDLIEALTRAISEIENSALRVSVYDTAKSLLSEREDCKHETHRIQPQDTYDWAAVDNMMHSVVITLMHNRVEHLNTMGVMLEAALASPPNTGLHPINRLELAGFGVVGDALSMILKHHYDLISESAVLFGSVLSTRSGADTHYAKILARIDKDFNKEKSDGRQGEARPADRPDVRNQQGDQGQRASDQGAEEKAEVSGRQGAARVRQRTH